MGLRGVVALVASLLAAVTGCTAAGFVSTDAQRPEHGLNGTGRTRTLLQATRECPVSFKSANFTVVTSRCKDPLYQLSLCCSLLKDFACGANNYSAYVNDPSTNCAGAMFSYLNIYGRYPPGLFASTCREGDDQVVRCPVAGAEEAVQPGREDLFGTAGTAVRTPPGVGVVVVVVLVAGVTALGPMMSW